MGRVDLLHVPYKGTGQALTDLLAGQVDLMFAPAQTVISHVRAGKLRALATTGEKRAAALPDLPTVAEAGLAGYAAVGWVGLLAPAATPKAIVAQLSRDANRVLGERDGRERMEALGAEPAGKTPEGIAPLIRPRQAAGSKPLRPAGPKPHMKNG